MGAGQGEIWDCESIVSTYSNTENHPARIGMPPKRRGQGQGYSGMKGAVYGDSTVAMVGKGRSRWHLVGRYRLPEGYGGRVRGGRRVGRGVTK